MEEKKKRHASGNRTGANNRAMTVKSVKSVEKRRAAGTNAAALHTVRAPRVVNVKKQDKTPFPWSVIVTAVIFTALFLFMMMNYAEVDKYRSEINELDNKIATMQKTQATLEEDFEKKININDIQDYAENELGMVKKSTLRSHVITIDQQDKSLKNEYDDGEEGGFGYLLAGIGEVIRDFAK